MAIFIKWSRHELDSRPIEITCPACKKAGITAKAYSAEFIMSAFYVFALHSYVTYGVRCSECGRRFSTKKNAFELSRLTPAELSAILKTAPPDSIYTRLGAILCLFLPVPFISMVLAFFCHRENNRIGPLWRYLGYLSLGMSTASTVCFTYALIRYATSS